MREHSLTKNKKNISRKKKMRWKRLFLLIMVLVGIITVVVWAGQKISTVATSINIRSVEIVQPEAITITEELLKKRINVLLLGIDDGDVDNPEVAKRTDAIILASFDPVTKEVALIAIPRDTRVKIPGHTGYDKANHAYAYGGAKLAKKMVATNLGVPVNYYILVDWQGFIEIIDLLGGIDIHVENSMKYEDPYANLKIDLERGYQHLDGHQAGEYVRFRADELGDIGRVQRQQKFLKAVVEQVFALETITKLPSILSTIHERVETDMNIMDMGRAINSFKSFSASAVKFEMLPGDFATVNNVSYWQIDQRAMNQMLQKLNLDYKEGVKQ